MSVSDTPARVDGGRAFDWMICPGCGDSLLGIGYLKDLLESVDWTRHYTCNRDECPVSTFRVVLP